MFKLFKKKEAKRKIYTRPYESYTPQELANMKTLDLIKLEKINKGSATDDKN